MTVKPKPSRLVQALDTNQDGRLSVDEIEAAVAILKGLDQDGNGELTSDEFGQVMTSKNSNLQEQFCARPAQSNQAPQYGRTVSVGAPRPSLYSGSNVEETSIEIEACYC